MLLRLQGFATRRDRRWYRAADRLQQLGRFGRVLPYKRRAAFLKLIAGQNGGDAQLAGRSPENLAFGQSIELFPPRMALEEFHSSRWITGQDAGGKIKCVTGTLKRM